MERLRLGAELRHEAGRHARRQRQRISRLLRGQAQQPRAGGGGADRAHGGGGVPAAVAVGRVHALAGAAHDLEPRDIGVEAIGARCALLLGEREDRGDEHRSGMRLCGIEIVVEIECVRGGAVDQRRPGRRQPGAEAEHRGRPFAPVPDRLEHDSSRRIERPGHADREHVEEGVVRRLHRRCGPVARRLGEPGSEGDNRIAGHAARLRRERAKRKLTSAAAAASRARRAPAGPRASGRSAA